MAFALILVASDCASAAADRHLRGHPARRAVRAPRGGRARPRRAAHDRAPGGRLARRRVADEVPGAGRLGALQRDSPRGPHPRARDRRRRARDLRRRVPDHPGLHHRRARLPAADPLHPRPVQADAAEPARPAHDPDPATLALRLRRGGHGERALRAAALRRAAPRNPITTPPHVTGPPLALSFFDPDRNRSGTARAGMTLLFEGSTPTTLPDGPQLERRGDGSLTAALGTTSSLPSSRSPTPPGCPACVRRCAP